MDDPWGSPWAADRTPPTIDLPAAPPHAHFPSSGAHSRSPKRDGAPPWAAAADDDDAWGGWNVAGGSGSPGWGRSPGLRPLSGDSVRQVSPGPWGRSAAEIAMPDLKEAERTLDSGISLGGGLGRDGSVDLRRSIALDERPQDVWAGYDDKATTAASSTPVTDAVIPPEPPGNTAGPVVGAEERPEPVREASKVQELVEMYDGIAKESFSPVETPVGATKSPTIPSEIPEDREPELHAANDQAAEADIDEAEGVVKTQDVDDDSDLGSETVQAQEEERPAALTKKPEQPDPIPSKPSSRPCYPVDLSSLDALFPSTPSASPNPEPIPDVIIDDTFASISERKAWYRLSRPGSMRRHNLGDDEGYVRASWADSHVRDRTIRIVRRWMEEDSIAGRVVLGRRTGGAVGAAMFGWDEAAPQVDVGELLGRRSMHSRQTSRASGTTAASPTVPAFGWSSVPTSPSVAEVASPRASMAKTNGHAALPGGPSPGVAAVLPPAKAPARPQSLNMALAAPTTPPDLSKGGSGAPDEDDDDEWGEMVSSPTMPVSAAARQDAPPAAPENGVASGPSMQATGRADGSRADCSVSAAPTASSQQSDPLASPDLGWLDGSSKPKPTSDSTSSSRTMSATRISETSHAKPSTQPRIRSPLTSTPVNDSTAEKHSDAHDDKVAAEILLGLPDLGYMLR